MIDKELLKKLTETKFYKKITEDPDNKVIYLGGSKSLGYDKEDSDYDLFILTTKKFSTHNDASAIVFYCGDISISINYITYPYEFTTENSDVMSVLGIFKCYYLPDDLVLFNRDQNALDYIRSRDTIMDIYNKNKFTVDKLRDAIPDNKGCAKLRYVSLKVVECFLNDLSREDTIKLLHETRQSIVEA